MSFFTHIKNVIGFLQLPKEYRKLTFYSEGKNYWPHLEGLVREVLATSDIDICYISSGKDDPGLALEHPRFRAFKIDEGFVRNWLFENIETDVMVMTMPDLHQYQVKRSKHKVHYVYVQHSLVSLHMVYRKGAFDHFDTIFCAGPHHVKEIRAMEAKYNLPVKNLVEHGYARLDAIIDEAAKREKPVKETTLFKHYLVAPSWGEHCIIEAGIGLKLVGQLLAEGHKVTLRPHPQTIKFSKNKVDEIVKKHVSNANFIYENNVAGQDSLHESDVMISDWSGAALDYAFGLSKPVLFADVPRKVNNPYYKEIGLEPFESNIRCTVGAIYNGKINGEITNKFNVNEHVYCVGYSSKVGSQYLVSCLSDKYE
ncbi:CDP-glycerol glycerophosphotransferase family protein [Vibrio sp. 10N.261.46.E11]|uniref:CDP-glycerol glycerophosphotransferase family protein n=1 Tax=Vibrio sp. 10N.261.46.E11 TaxID=3229662 RepID=UPI0035535CC6